MCERIETEFRMYADDLWVVHLTPELEVPGWTTLSLRRHADGPMSMNDEEAHTFGPMLVRVTAAVKAATPAERVWVMAMGEHEAHWHVLLVARGAEVPPEHRSLELLSSHRDSLVDVPRTLEVATKIRELLTVA